MDARNLNPEPTIDPGALAGQGLGSIGAPGPDAGLMSQYRAFAGPALLVSVGYMDPGNWATDLAGGAQYRFGLLWVVLGASLMALVLQLIAARLGVAAGKDLAQASREAYPRWRIGGWIIAEIGIVACDLAEVLGSAVAINLLFHIPIQIAVVVTAADVLLLLGMQRLGIRLIEAVVLVMVVTIAGCFALELFVLPRHSPDMAAMGAALLRPRLASAGMATIAVGIIGATVMPHNLYLHSALVRTRRVGDDGPSRRAAIRWSTVDTGLALSLAFFVNAAILALGAMTFFGRSAVEAHGVAYPLGPDTDWIRVAFLTLAPLMGAGAASALFAVALLASGQSSTITGTLAGQVVMEGFLSLRMSPWLRRLATRTAAIVPAVLLIGLRGGEGVTGLLVMTQVILALQLPFAMFPLLHLTGARSVMGEHATPPILRAAGWACAIVITSLDAYALPGAVGAAWRSLFG